MEPKDYKLAAVMFTDIVGFSRMMEQDEVGTLATMEVHNQIVRSLVASHRGKVIKTIGDAFLADFPTALDAVKCSVAVQAGILEYSQSGSGKPLQLRIGVHLGDIYFYENDALGEGINIASRLQSTARPGCINISREVYSQVSGKLPLRVNNLGQLSLKNISREIHAYEILPEGEDLVPVPDSSRPTESSPAMAAATTAPQGFGGLKKDWHQLKATLKNEWDTSLKGELKEAFKDIGREISQFFEPKDSKGRVLSPFEQYKRKAEKEAQSSSEGVLGHLFSYLGIMVALFFLNSRFPGMVVPWAGIVALSWGIGLAAHLASVRPARATLKELESLDDLDAGETKELKKHQEARLGFWTHLSSNSMIILLLVFINFAFPGTKFPWSFIPGAILAMGILGHAAGYPAQRKRRLGFFERIKNRVAGVQAVKGDAPALTEAKKVRKEILDQISLLKPGENPFGEDMTPVLDHYVAQISELVSISGDLDRVLQGVTSVDLDREEQLLKQKLERQSSEVLRLEYNKNLFELEKQKKSVRDLGDQRELLELRISSGVKNLRQLQMELARLRGTGQESAAMTGLKTRSEELNQYIADYREAMKVL